MDKAEVVIQLSKKSYKRLKYIMETDGFKSSSEYIEDAINRDFMATVEFEESNKGENDGTL